MLPCYSGVSDGAAGDTEKRREVAEVCGYASTYASGGGGSDIRGVVTGSEAGRE